MPTSSRPPVSAPVSGSSRFIPTLASGHPDYGLLYISVGDGDQTPVFSTDPQDLTVLRGKILRIDPLGVDGPSGEYGIPVGILFHRSCC